MIAREKTSSSDHRGKVLKLSTRSLFQTIKRARSRGACFRPSTRSLFQTKHEEPIPNHAIRNKIPRRWSHVDLLMEFTIKKGIFDIKLRNGPSTN
jgi:hypothetical protein